MELLFIPLLFIGVFLGGLYAGNVGGGSLVGFPLLLLIGLPTHAAIASMRFSAVILEFFTTLKFYKEGRLNLKFGLILGVFAAIGAVIGTNIVISTDEKNLNLIVGVLLLAVLLVIFNKDKIGLKEVRVKQNAIIPASIFTLLLGIYGGFFGAGFGTFIMILMALFGFTFIQSAAIGRVVGLFMSVSSTYVFASQGLINYTYGLSLGFGFALGGWVGVGYALKKGNECVRVLLLMVVILTILKLVFDFFGVKLV